MMIKSIIKISTCLLLFLSNLHSDSNSHLSLETWESVCPYLLPDELDVKQQLDEMFKKSRILLNSETLKKAGFTNYKPRQFTRVIVSKHPEFPGFVFKIYLDAQRYKSDVPEHLIFLDRIFGAGLISEFIEKNGLDHLFKVPKKWIYLLPEEPKAPKEFPQKNFILVEEDMYLLDRYANSKYWKSENISEELLVGLFQILKHVGLNDCAKIDNIPFCEDGKVAFIDTQSFGSKSVPFKRLKSSLSPTMQNVWEKLIHNEKNSKG